MKKKKENKMIDSKKFSEEAYRHLRWFHLTEKSTNLTADSKYVFVVDKKANKVEIKKAVEKIFGVDVIKVNVINLPPKPKRLGRSQGYKKGIKKAIVALKEGEKIDI